MRGLRLAGRASGHNEIDVAARPLRRARGSGTAIVVTRRPARAAGAASCRRTPRRTRASAYADRRARSAITRRSTPVPVAGDVTYAFDPEAMRLRAQPHLHRATPTSRSRAPPAYGERSKIPFRVTSRNWQESDRFLAGIMTAFGAPTRAIPIDGVGKFDGVMLGAFRRPRIEGRFTGCEMRAWDVTWGDDRRRLRRRELVRQRQPRVDSHGRVAHGRDRAVLARLSARRRRRRDQRAHRDRRAARWPICARRSTSQDYDVDGTLSGDFHVYGAYTAAASASAA